MTTKQRRNRRSAEEKAAILKRHYVDKVPISTLCDELGLQPSVFYHWQRDLFERAPQVLDKSAAGAGRRRLGPQARDALRDDLR